jgi:hypothetical protein
MLAAPPALKLTTARPSQTLPQTLAVDGKKLISALKQVLEIVQNNSILTLGQNEVFPDALICHGHIPANIRADLPATCPSPILT